MRRPFTITTCAVATLMLTSVPAALYAQTNPPAQQPTQQGTPQTPAPAQQTPPPAQPAGPPKLAFTTQAGLLLIQIKKDQTAAFEELMAKIRSGAAKATDETVKKQLAGFKAYKSSEDMAGNALYVVIVDPALKDTEYELFMILQKVLTPEELRDPAVIEMSKKAAAAFTPQGYNRLNLTPLGGGM
jgi:hypothetical protein